MPRRALKAALTLGLAAALAFWALSRPARLPPGATAGLAGDPERGARIFAMGGCAACHAAPGAEGEARLRLGGGRRFVTPFGTFVAPNISPDPEHGIGRWSVADLADALLLGTSPDGRHYYPALPWTSYARARPAEVADLHAYLMTLPPVASTPPGHELGFPFSIRRGIGLWKRLFLRREWVIPDAGLSAEARRGREIVEGWGHCGECHTPRGAFGQPLYDRWLGGAPNPVGKGRIPNLTPAALDWSAEDIVLYLKTGLTPDYDSVGGEMAEVVTNLSTLPEADLRAIAAYLKALPPVPEPARR